MENRNSSEQINAHFQSTNHLEFKQAMQDFQTMFPEMDQDVIEEVLRANKGAINATIDHLLSMTTDNLNESLRLHLEKMEEEKNGKEKRDVKNECSLLDSNISRKNISSCPLTKWSPPLVGPLPPTFLRIQPILYKPDSHCEEDERIALFLQNEEFLSELRVNQDFMSTLDQDVNEKNANGGGGGGPDIELFKERLRNMGKISRNKFSQLSKVFQRRKKNRTAKGILDQSALGDSMLLGSEPFLLESQDDSCSNPVPSLRTTTAKGNAIDQ